MIASFCRGGFSPAPGKAQLKRGLAPFLHPAFEPGSASACCQLRGLKGKNSSCTLGGCSGTSEAVPGGLPAPQMELGG